MAYREPEPPPETVEEALLAERGEDLARLLRVAKVPRPHPTRKADMAVVLDKRLDGQSLHTLWNALDPLQQAAVAEATHNLFGLFDARLVHAKYGDLPEGYRLKNYDDTSILRLFLYRQNNFGPPVFMPDELAMRLRDFVPMPEPATLATQQELPNSVQRATRLQWRRELSREDFALTQRDMERVAQQDLLAVLRLIDSGKVAVGPKTGRASAAAMERIADILAGGDFYELAKIEKGWERIPGAIRAFAWPWLMQSGRLATRNGSKLLLQGRL